MPEILFNQVDERLPAWKRWQVARHEYSGYDAALRTAANKRHVIEQYALAAMHHAQRQHDKLLAAAVMDWAQAKLVH